MVLAVPTQDTFSVGEILTAALMNKNVRDGVNFALNPPIFSGVQNTAQSIPNNAVTSVTFDSEKDDSYGGHSNASNNSRYTAVVAGYYLVSGRITWPNSATGRRVAELLVNGGAFWACEVAPVNGSNNQTSMVVGMPYLNVGDYCEIGAYQNSGAALTLVVLAGYTSSMEVLWVHA